ncbi:hypothetical protein [Nonomuraea sp. NPDC048826]
MGMINHGEPEYPGDVYWYDLPDDEADVEEAVVPANRLRRLIPFFPWRTA